MAGNPTFAGAGAQAATAPRFNIFEKPVSAPRPAAQGSHGVFDCASACAPAGSGERPAAATYRRRRRATPILTWAALLAAVIALVAAWAQLRGDAPDRAAPWAPAHHQPRAREPRQNTAARRGLRRPLRRTRKRAKPHRATRPRHGARRLPAPPPAVVPPPRAPLLSPQRAMPPKPPEPRRLPARVAPGAPPEFM